MDEQAKHEQELRDLLEAALDPSAAVVDRVNAISMLIRWLQVLGEELAGREVTPNATT
jgi:hypothetical protein